MRYSRASEEEISATVRQIVGEANIVVATFGAIETSAFWARWGRRRAALVICDEEPQAKALDTLAPLLLETERLVMFGGKSLSLPNRHNCRLPWC